MSKATSSITPLDEVARALTDPTAKLSVVEEQDAEAAASRIVQGILDSADPFERVKALGGRDLIGVPLRVTAVDWRNSDLAGDGLGIFAVMHATQQDGTQAAITCGGRNVLAQLYRAVRDGLLPVDVLFSEGKPTAKGYKPLWLERCKWEEGAF